LTFINTRRQCADTMHWTLRENEELAMQAGTQVVFNPIAVPGYLWHTYRWAYVEPLAVRFFERQWLVNLILWGNFERLRDAAVEALGPRLDGRNLQVACVYGDLTNRVRAHLTPAGRLDVVDVLRVQLENTLRKVPSDPRVGLIQADSTALDMESATYDRVLLFFLLHEQPEEVRRRTLAEAFRVVKPGGRIVILDYHRPKPTHPLYLPMVAILKLFEPFAMDLWRGELDEWFPAEPQVERLSKTTFFGELYQLVTLKRR
jgi:ubiquinone/menaquinone biosynthesis C-methylase UbiE